jgi:hypothetical protein
MKGLNALIKSVYSLANAINMRSILQSQKSSKQPKVIVINLESSTVATAGEIYYPGKIIMASKCFQA